MIKPDLFLNEQFSDLSFQDRYVYFGLAVLAGRDGVITASPKSLKAKLLPYEDGNIETILTALEKAGFIARNDGVITLTGFVQRRKPRRTIAEEVIQESIENF